MDRRVLRERMRRKQRQIRRRKIIKLVTYVVAMVLAVIFVIRGVIFPIVSRIGGKSTGSSQQVQADAEGEDTSDSGTDSTEAQRQPLKGQSDVTKVASLTPGWHEDDNGRWYQNADGTYYTNGFAEIDGVEYAFDSNGYMQTGWVTKGVNDYYFNDDGSYNPEKKRPLIALTFDDGPGKYTDKILSCLEKYDARATFFVQGKNVSGYASSVSRAVGLGCEIGNHTWSHVQLTRVSGGEVGSQISRTNNAVYNAAGVYPKLYRPPYGSYNSSVLNSVAMPAILWSVDTLDWKTRNADKTFACVQKEAADGAIILMHDIHAPTAAAVERIVPQLLKKGYQLVTVSELLSARKGGAVSGRAYRNAR